MKIINQKKIKKLTILGIIIIITLSIIYAIASLKTHSDDPIKIQDKSPELKVTNEIANINENIILMHPNGVILDNKKQAYKKIINKKATFISNSNEKIENKFFLKIFNTQINSNQNTCNNDLENFFDIKIETKNKNNTNKEKYNDKKKPQFDFETNSQNSSIDIIFEIKIKESTDIKQMKNLNEVFLHCEYEVVESESESDKK